MGRISGPDELAWKLSGTWEASIKEKAQTRKETRELKFSNGGHIQGTGRWSRSYGRDRLETKIPYTLYILN